MGTYYFCYFRRGRTLPIIAQRLKLAGGLVVLVFFTWAGQALTAWFNIPLPGPLTGMLLLLVILSSSNTLTILVRPTSELLINSLSLLFIPACVGAFFLDDITMAQFPNLLLVIILSTPLSIIFLVLLIKAIRDSEDA
ncbi:MAG: CidA/LrgA family protein [Porticoccaceae bacterium]|nr:CidA/LrgA family protein [Porticoccaceae bacterium]MDG1475428.1 CidA/LrgA family protein [Porticoccaceae bacterium]